MQSALCAACREGRVSTVRAMLSDGANVDALGLTVDGRGTRWNDSPLGWAVDGASFDVLQLLLDKKANPNRFASHGSTPLHLAAQRGDLQAVKLLVSHGADYNLCSRDGVVNGNAVAWTLGHIHSLHDGPENQRARFCVSVYGRPR